MKYVKRMCHWCKKTTNFKVTHNKFRQKLDGRLYEYVHYECVECGVEQNHLEPVNHKDS